jgi:hypothetical protein
MNMQQLREMEGLVDEMIEFHTDPREIVACCNTAVLESLMVRGLDAPDKLKRLDVYR